MLAIVSVSCMDESILDMMSVSRSPCIYMKFNLRKSLLMKGFECCVFLSSF